MVDQSPLARTPRSTPILYLGLYDRVRELFAAQPEAMAQGLTASAFSFNSGSGRCERCCGTGFEKIEMQFLSDLYVRCAECEGQTLPAARPASSSCTENRFTTSSADGERSDPVFRADRRIARSSAIRSMCWRKSGSVICGSASRSTLFPAANRSGSSSSGISRTEQCAREAERRPPAAISSSSTNRRPACISTMSRCW